MRPCGAGKPRNILQNRPAAARRCSGKIIKKMPDFHKILALGGFFISIWCKTQGRFPKREAPSRAKSEIFKNPRAKPAGRYFPAGGKTADCREKRFSKMRKLHKYKRKIKNLLEKLQETKMLEEIQNARWYTRTIKNESRKNSG